MMESEAPAPHLSNFPTCIDSLSSKELEELKLQYVTSDEEDVFKHIHPESSEEEDDEIKDDSYTSKWQSCPGNFSPNIHPFDDSIAGITDEFPLPLNAKEIDYFTLLFDEEIVNFIIQETNIYHDFASLLKLDDHGEKCHSKEWKSPNLDEMYTFFGLTMLMAYMETDPLGQIYGSDDPLISRNFFQECMSQDRYDSILQHLHFANNKKPNFDDTLWKVRDILGVMKNKIKRYFKPSQNVVIDQSLILFREPVVLKLYIPTDGYRFNLKILVLCDCKTGIALDTFVYTSYDSGTPVPKHATLGFSGTIIDFLMEPYYNKGHILFTGDYFSSPPLCDYLYEKKTGSFGLAENSKKYMPKFKKLKRGNAEKFSNGNLLAIKFKDQLSVTMLTNVHTGEIKDSRNDPEIMELDRKCKEIAPDIILDFAFKMMSVNKSDVHLSQLHCLNDLKWYKKLFFHLLDITLLNSYNLYMVRTGKTKKPSQVKFYGKVITQLLEKHANINLSQE